jgi:WD40 repeat protein
MTNNIVRAVTFAAINDVEFVVAGGEGSEALLWSLGGVNTKPLKLIGHSGTIADMAISGDGRWLATCSWETAGGDNTDETVRVWDLAAPNPATSSIVLGHAKNWLRQVRFSPDDHWVVSREDNGFLRRWTWQPQDLLLCVPAAAGRELREHERVQYQTGRLAGR